MLLRNTTHCIKSVNTVNFSESMLKKAAKSPIHTVLLNINLLNLSLPIITWVHGPILLANPEHTNNYKTERKKSLTACMYECFFFM